MIIILLISVGIAAIATYLTWRSLQNAPVGYEDETGFHAIRCRGCKNLQEDDQGRRCLLGYSIRSSFFTGARPDGVCQARSAPELIPPAVEPAGKARRTSNG